jgi:hypothetical protein
VNSVAAMIPTVVVKIADREVARAVAPALAEEWRVSGASRETAQDALGVPTPRIRTPIPREA